jgi:hypothetical protein
VSIWKDRSKYHWLTKIRTRPGERVAKRRRAKSRVGTSHKIKRDETVKWFKNRFEVSFSTSVSPGFMLIYCEQGIVR